MGSGKSAIMFYIVHQARLRNWFVVYIPRCDSWYVHGRPDKDGWYAYFFDAVRAGLQFVDDQIKVKYAYCFPPNGHDSWERAALKQVTKMEDFQMMYCIFAKHIQTETGVEVLLAFDDSHTLNHHGVAKEPPFQIITFSHLKRGCIFVTSATDTLCNPMCNQTRVLSVGALTE
jgi:hypothetical protein